jgi:hypothetical protein
VARAQTIFSELCVAVAIADTVEVRDIENVDTNSASIYENELIARKDSKQKAASINALSLSGKAVRKYLLDNGITPRRVIWTGSQSIGAMVAVAKDIEVANYRISVKENANVFINGSPITVFEDMPSGIFGQKRKGRDWFAQSAHNEFQNYYSVCRQYSSISNQHERVEDFYKNSKKEQKKLFGADVAKLHNSENEAVLRAYSEFCNKVSVASAQIFNENLAAFRSIHSSHNALQPIFHYFFRINGIKYILAGTENNKPFAVILHASSEWTREYQFLGITASPKFAGQPEVLLSFRFKKISTKEEFIFDLKVEIRWSHGKFCGNPEAKVYKTWSYTELPWSENLYLN